MVSGGSVARAARWLIVVLAIGCMAAGLVVLHAKQCIQRGARWTGISLDGGLALVFVCEPQSGIRRAFFHVWPWKKIVLEKINSGA
jgi:hypothetical protein